MSKLKDANLPERKELGNLMNRFNKKLTSFKYSDYGFINSICFVKTSDKKEFVLKIIGDMWNSRKTLNEISAIKFLKKRTKIPVPTIIDYDCGKEKLGCQYILMERIFGKPLKEVWEKANNKERLNLLNQIADIFVEMKQFKFDKIGAFQENMNIGPLADTSCGPFDTFSDYISSQIRFRYSELEKDKLTRPYIPKFEEFIEKVVSNYNKKMPFVMTHGDMFRNFLVHKGKITGLLDFEWAKASPIEDDADSIGGHLSDIKPFLEMLAKRGLDVKKEWKERKDIYEVERKAMILASHKFWTPFIKRPEDSEEYIKENLANLDKIFAKRAKA